MELISVVGTVELTGLSSQIDGLGHSRKGVRYPAHFDLLSSVVLACPDPCINAPTMMLRSRGGTVEGLRKGSMRAAAVYAHQLRPYFVRSVDVLEAY